MTNKSAVEKAIEIEQQRQEKMSLQYLVQKKKMNRADYRGAVEALDKPQDEWDQLDLMIFTAWAIDRSKGWEHYLDMTEEELEKVILGK